MTLEFNDDGTTNFKNVKWSDNFLFIVTDNGVIANFMNIMTVSYTHLITFHVWVYVLVKIVLQEH